MAGVQLRSTYGPHGKLSSQPVVAAIADFGSRLVCPTLATSNTEVAPVAMLGLIELPSGHDLMHHLQWNPDR